MKAPATTWKAMLLILVVAVLGTTAPAQDTGLGSGEVEVEVESFGVAARARQGSMVGVRVRIRNLGSQNTEVIVRVEGVDRDGDTPFVDRTINANFNVWLGVWLYVRLPHDFESSERLSISVYEAIESGDRFRPGRLLGRQYTQARVSSKTDEIWGILGSRQYRLGDYGNGLQMAPTARAFGQGRVDVAPNIRINELPDHWYGLQTFDMLCFAQQEAVGMRAESAEAIKEWVRRGGHLVVVL
ncbi:MAG: hypothetical protein KDA28_09915, partial [Phycisphaerales bacterium]|nr:hypothetical protein [Phycisphaerales bacterium]